VGGNTCLQSLSEVVGTHVVLDCKWSITVFYTQYRSPPPPPTPINVAPTKTHQTWRERGHNIKQGAGGLTFYWNSKVLWHLSQDFWNWLSERQWKAYLTSLNYRSSILEYQFRENYIAFSITCLLNCIGICNVRTVLRLLSISLKCNTIQQCIINELILKDVSVGSVVCRAIKPGLYAREKTHLSG
jgi:predicted transport protein